MDISSALFLIMTLLFTAVSQVMQKCAANQLNQTSSNTFATLTNPAFVCALALLGMGLLCWLMVLKNMDVGLAYPLLSLNYVLVLMASKLVFKETIPIQRWVGCAMIMAGVILLARAQT